MFIFRTNVKKQRLLLFRIPEKLQKQPGYAVAVPVHPGKQERREVQSFQRSVLSLVDIDGNVSDPDGIARRNFDEDLGRGPGLLQRAAGRLRAVDPQAGILPRQRRDIADVVKMAMGRHNSVHTGIVRQCGLHLAAAHRHKGIKQDPAFFCLQQNRRRSKPGDFHGLQFLDFSKLSVFIDFLRLMQLNQKQNFQNANREHQDQGGSRYGEQAEYKAADLQNGVNLPDLQHRRPVQVLSADFLQVQNAADHAVHHVERQRHREEPGHDSSPAEIRSDGKQIQHIGRCRIDRQHDRRDSGLSKTDTLIP